MGTLRYDDAMETFISTLVVSLLTVFTIDATRKRREFLKKQKHA
jgi:hypothetical protein